MRHKLVLILVIVSVVPAVSNGQYSGYDFLNLDLSARSAGMGGAFVSVAGDLYSVFYNPAGSGEISERTIGFTFLDYILDIKSGNIVWAVAML